MGPLLSSSLKPAVSSLSLIRRKPGQAMVAASRREMVG